MICPSCKQEIEDGSKFCSFCGVSLKEAEAESKEKEDAANNPIQNSVFASQTPTTEEKTKKKFPWKIMLGVLVACVCFIGVFVALRWPYLKNASESKKDPRSYLQGILKNEVKESSKQIGDTYGYWKELLDSVYSHKISVNAGVNIGPAIKKLIKDKSYDDEMDIDWFNSYGIAATVNHDDQKHSADLQFALNDVNLISLQAFLDNENEEVYFKIPELSDTCNVIKIDGMKDYMAEMKKYGDELISLMPEKDEVQNYVYDYLEIAIDAIGDVEREEKEIYVDDQSHKCVAFSFEIDKEMLKSIVVNVKEKIKNDEKFKESCYKLAEKFGEDKEEVYQSAIEKLEERLKPEIVDDIPDDLKTVCHIYMDQLGNLYGFECNINSDDGYMDLKSVNIQDGSQVSTEISGSADGKTIKLVGNGTNKANKLNGNYKVSYNGTNLLDITVQDYDYVAALERGEMRGKISMQLSTGIQDLLNLIDTPFDLSGAKIDMDCNIGRDDASYSYLLQFDGAEQLGTKFSYKIGAGEAITLPNDSEMNRMDMNNARIGLLKYAQTITKEKISALKENLQKANVPEDIIEEIPQDISQIY